MSAEHGRLWLVPMELKAADVAPSWELEIDGHWTMDSTELLAHASLPLSCRLRDGLSSLCWLSESLWHCRECSDHTSGAGERSTTSRVCGLLAAH